MPEAPLVSIVMPVYNAAAYLEAALSSVLGQTLRELELICVDDCSSDGSLALLEARAATDPRLTVVRAERNGGPGSARNLGLSRARGAWVGFVDADDEIPPWLLERAVERLRRDGADEVVWGLRELHYAADGTLKKTREVLPEDGCFRGGEIPFAVARLEKQTLFGYQCNSLYSGAVLREHNIVFPPDTLYEDLFFNLGFIRYAQGLSTMACCGYDYKKHAGSVTHRPVPDYFALSEKRVSRMYDYLRENGALNDATRGLLRDRILRYALSALARDADPAAGLSARERNERIGAIKASPILRRLLYGEPGRISPVYLPAALALRLPNGAARLLGQAVRRLV